MPNPFPTGSQRRKVVDKDSLRRLRVESDLQLVIHLAALGCPCFVVIAGASRECLIELSEIFICAVPFVISLFWVLRSGAVSVLAWSALAASLVWLALFTELIQKPGSVHKIETITGAA